MGKKTTNSTKPAEPQKRIAKASPPPEPEPSPVPAPALAKAPKPKAAAKPKAKPVKTKPAAKAAAKPAGKGKKPVFSHDDVALRAYFIAEKRQALGIAGDAHLDWVEAERQLAAEARGAKKKAK